jgi:hypothetical protein
MIESIDRRIDASLTLKQECYLREEMSLVVEVNTHLSKTIVNPKFWAIVHGVGLNAK